MATFSFGCTEKWAIVVCEMILFSGLLFCLKNKNFEIFPSRLRDFGLFTLFLILISFIQVIPLPNVAIEIFDGDRKNFYEKSLEVERLLQDERYRIDPFENKEIPKENRDLNSYRKSSFKTLSRAPISTLRGIIALISFYVFLLFLNDLIKAGNRYLRKFAIYCGILGLIVSLIALYEKGMEEKTKILFMRESARASISFGPFVNSNHGLAFLNLSFSILAYILYRSLRKKREIFNKIGITIILVSLLILQGSLVFSGGSRSNFLYFVILPLVFFLQKSLNKKNFTMGVLGAIYFLVLLGAIGFFYSSGLLFEEVRIEMNPNVINEINIIGYGLGSFEEVFPAKIKEWPIFYEMRNVFLENEYLQLYFECGLVGLMGALILLFSVLKNLFKILIQYDKGFFLVCGLLAELLRVYFDMSFHIFPIVALFVLIYALILGKLRE